MSAILGVNRVVGRANYLGLPMLVGRNKRQMFGLLKEKILSRIRGWNQRFLSRVGRDVILKSTIEAIASYAMGVFLIPKEIIREIEITMNGFWWKGSQNGNNRGIRWKS